jgi:hypothetical protein
MDDSSSSSSSSQGVTSNFSNVLVQFLLGPKVYALFISTQKTASWIESISFMDVIRILLITYKLYFIVTKLYKVFTYDENINISNISEKSYTEQPFFDKLPWWKYLFFGRWGTMFFVSGIFSWFCCFQSMMVHNHIKKTEEPDNPIFTNFIQNIRKPKFLGLLFLFYILINASFFFLLDASDTFDNTAKSISISLSSLIKSEEEEAGGMSSTRTTVIDFALEDFMIFTTILLLCLPFLSEYFKVLPMQKIVGMILLLLSIVGPFLYTLYVRVACFSGTWNVMTRILEYFMENLPEFVILIYFSFYFSFSFELYESVNAVIEGKEKIKEWFSQYGIFLFLVVVTVVNIVLRRYLIKAKWFLPQTSYRKIITNLGALLFYLLCAGIVFVKRR